MGHVEIEVAIRGVWGDSVTLLLIKVWCLAKGITATGVDLGVSFAEVVESMSKLEKCWASKHRTKLVTFLQLSWQKGKA